MIRASGQKGGLGGTPQHPLLVAILSELGKGAGSQRQGVSFFKDQPSLEREPGPEEGQSEQKIKLGL